MIDQTLLDRLRDTGLLVSETNPCGPYPGGYSIGKPVSVPGNTRPDEYEVFWGLHGPVCDAPVSRLIPNGSEWIFEVHEWVPGPGYSDFRITYSTAEQAIEAVLSYYFGDPAWMNPPPPAPLVTEDKKHCATCGSPVLKSNGNTPWEEAEYFLSTATFEQASEYLHNGFLPPALYCARCGVLAITPLYMSDEEREFFYLIDAGPRRQEVIVKLRQRLNIHLRDAKKIVDQPDVLLACLDGASWDHEWFRSLLRELQALGAQVKYRVERRQRGAALKPWVIVDREL